MEKMYPDAEKERENRTYLEKMKELDLSAVDDCSSFSGETVVLHGNEDNESISIRLPAQFNSSKNGPLYHRHLNVADYNTESYIEVTTEVNSGAWPSMPISM